MSRRSAGRPSCSGPGETSALLTASTGTLGPACPCHQPSSSGSPCSYTASTGTRTVPPDHTYDLRGFSRHANPTPRRYPFWVGRRSSLSTAAVRTAIIGGRVVGDIQRSWIRDQWSNSTYDGDAIRVAQKADWSLVADTYVKNESDA